MEFQPIIPKIKKTSIFLFSSIYLCKLRIKKASRNTKNQNNKKNPTKTKYAPKTHKKLQTQQWLSSQEVYFSGARKLQKFYLRQSSKMTDLFIFFRIKRASVLYCNVLFLTLVSTSFTIKWESFKIYDFHYLLKEELFCLLTTASSCLNYLKAYFIVSSISFFYVDIQFWHPLGLTSIMSLWVLWFNCTVFKKLWSFYQF